MGLEKELIFFFAFAGTEADGAGGAKGGVGGWRAFWVNLAQPLKSTYGGSLMDRQ